MIKFDHIFLSGNTVDVRFRDQSAPTLKQVEQWKPHPTEAVCHMSVDLWEWWMTEEMKLAKMRVSDVYYARLWNGIRFLETIFCCFIPLTTCETVLRIEFFIHYEVSNPINVYFQIIIIVGVKFISEKISFVSPWKRRLHQNCIDVLYQIPQKLSSKNGFIHLTFDYIKWRILDFSQRWHGWINFQINSSISKLTTRENRRWNQLYIFFRTIIRRWDFEILERVFFSSNRNQCYI